MSFLDTTVRRVCRVKWAESGRVGEMMRAPNSRQLKSDTGGWLESDFLRSFLRAISNGTRAAANNFFTSEWFTAKKSSHIEGEILILNEQKISLYLVLWAMTTPHRSPPCMHWAMSIASQRDRVSAEWIADFVVLVAMCRCWWRLDWSSHEGTADYWVQRRWANRSEHRQTDISACRLLLRHICPINLATVTVLLYWRRPEWSSVLLWAVKIKTTYGMWNWLF